VHRYFTQALPLHVADEEQSIEPRLRALGRADLDAALARMEAQHDEHEPMLARLIPRWAQLAERPEAALAAATRADAGSLVRAMEDHLSAEEQSILPAVASLPVEQQQAIAAEMRARRD
jgi:hemerythrin-like domain-containing protein